MASLVISTIAGFGAAGVIAAKLLGSMGTLVTLSLVTLSVWAALPLYIAVRIFDKQNL